jgi:molecular chaperone HscB
MFDPFATLGLGRRFDLDPADIEARYRDLQRALHPDRHAGGTASERRLSLSRAIEVNEAYRTLKDDLRRAEALLALHASAHGGEEEAADPAFLAEVMDLREALGEARDRGDLARVHALAANVATRERAAREDLARAFGSGMAAPDSDALAAIARLVGRLKYFRRFADEVGVIEESVAR